MTQPEYEYTLRNISSLTFIDELRPQDVVGNWTRKQHGGGTFELRVPFVTGADNSQRYPATNFEGHPVLIIKRNGSIEFAGVVERRQVDPLGKVWIISGPDLTAYWLQQRVVGEDNADARTGLAETVLLAYIEAYLGATAAAARRATAYIDVTFTVPTTSGRGATVDVTGNRQSLFALCQQIAEAGGILFSIDVNSDYSGYTVSVSEPTDATISGGGVPFSVAWDNVEKLEFDEDYSQYRNHMIVAGDGTGNSRNISEVADSSSITTHMRREVVVDARYATTADQRATVGAYEIAKRNRQRIKVKAKPNRASANAVYREDWDVGWDVSFQEPMLRSDAIDIRVVAATISISMNGDRAAEDIQYELGETNGGSIIRKLADAVTQLRASSNV